MPSDDKQAAYDPGQPPSKQFGNPVHCVRLSNDGKVYVCDRVNNRVQVFEPGGKFIAEYRVEPLTRANGSLWDMVLSHDAAQKYLYVADGANGHGGRVQVGAQHGHRPAGQPLHVRSRLRTTYSKVLPDVVLASTPN